MPSFSKASLQKLETCDAQLQKILHEAIKIYDFTVLCGTRNEEEQKAAFVSGRSNARWGESPHNFTPSRAVDIAPYPINWQNRERFAELAGVIKAVAHNQGVPITWGGDFKKLCDMPHFELTNWREY